MSGPLVEFAPGFSCHAAGCKDAEEARFYYKEIFQDHGYDVAQLGDNPFILDAGANIGLFSLYMKQKYPSSKIIAFEPAPETFANLTENIKRHGATGVELHQTALGSKETTQTFTFFPNFPGNSTLVPEEKEKVKDVASRLEGGNDIVDRMYANPVGIEVPIQRLSHFIPKDLTCIDLLKVDVEGVELDVLRGVDDEHWALVRNVVVELCNLQDELAELEALLRSKGFTLKSELSPWSPPEVKMYMVLGHRAP